MKLFGKKESLPPHPSIYSPDLIEQVFSHLPSALFANLLLSLLLVVILWSVGTHQVLIVWISVLWALTIVRTVQYLKYRSRKNDSVVNWAYQFNIGAILTGIVWGSSGILLFPEFSLQHQVFLAFVLGGLIAGATTSLSAIQWLLKVFVCLLIFPIALRFLFIGEEIYLTMGSMLIIYGGLCIIMSSHINIMLINSIRLKYENKEEIEKRKKAEDYLKKAHQQLERKVQERTKELQKTLTEVQTLRRILPICSHCKKVRNDEGYYEQIEGYMHKHSGVDFSHTICPQCLKKHYPKEYERITLNKKNVILNSP